MKKICLVSITVILASLIAVSMAFSQIPEKKFATRDGSRPNSLFAPGVMVGKTLYISGKGDYRPDEDYPEKVKNCLNEIKKSLAVMNLDMRHVVKSFCYLQDHTKYPEFNKIYAEFFPNEPPARTTLGVPQVPGDSEIEITCIAYADLSEKKMVGAPPEGFPFSPGIIGGKTLYISGKGDHLPDGKHPGTYEEQVRQSMRNIEGVLKQAGLGWDNVVMSHVFLDNYDNLGMTNKVYSEFFDFGNEPARATVFVDWV
ncbi:MAG: RidA family protein, partial [Candidatus Latescibacteria bacterium]|nr:RidA family protein [Candidatus Latescibacterota bacterium]